MRLKNVFWLTLLGFWSVSALAAQSAFAEDIGSISPRAIVIVLVLALIGGATYATEKIANPEIILKSIPAEVIKDLLSAVLSGLLIFFFGVWRGWDSMLIVCLITIGSYGGTRFLRSALAAFTTWISRSAERVN